MEKYRKAIVAVLGGSVTLLAPFVPGIEDVLNPDIIQALSVILTSVLVYQIPNQGV